MQLRSRILASLFLLGFAAAPAYGLTVTKQNRIYAQSEEKITITCVSASPARRGQILNVYTPAAQFALDTSTSQAGAVIALGTFTKDSEIIFQLLDPRTGFSSYNDPRNNMDLENHIRVTDLGQGRFLIGWQQQGGEDGSFNDLVIMIQPASASAANTPQRSAASSAWRRYE